VISGFIRGERNIIMTVDETPAAPEDEEHAGLFESEGDEHGPDEDDDGS
jgi:hypothetical protein